ncbi:hypothetical protein [Pseudomonas sp. 4810-S13]|uniref:hypothetical protein n=1 Tax=Pseudomonas sp. 4810-S13 TaxID=3120822 RepID=UPI0031B6B817
MSTTENTTAALSAPLTLTLDSEAVAALLRYRKAHTAFATVGHGAEEGADLYLAVERAAEELGKRVAALAPGA